MIISVILFFEVFRSTATLPRPRIIFSARYIAEIAKK